MDAREQNERIKNKNREAVARAYENMKAALEGDTDIGGINAILAFLNERERVDTALSLSKQLAFIEEKLHIKTRYTELDADWYTICALPMLVKTADGRWCAVIPLPGGRCKYIDDGKKIKITDKNADMFTNSAVCFYKCMSPQKLGMRALTVFMIKCCSKKDGAAIATASVLSALAGMLLPWTISFIFSYIIPSGDSSGTAAAAALMLSAVLTAAILGLLQSLILTNTMLRCGVYVQGAMFSRLLSLRPEFFKSARAGELANMITEFSDITRIVSVRGITACIGMALSLVYLIQIRIYAPQLLWWVLLISVLLAALMTAEGVMNSRWLSGCSKSLSKMSGFCYELFSGIEQIKLNGAEARIFRRWSERYLDAARHEKKPFLLKYSAVVYRLVRICATAVIFLFGARLAASDYIAFSSAYGAYIAASAGAAVIIQMIASFRSSYLLIKPVLDAECEECVRGKKRPESFKGDINISELRFRYDSKSPYIINGLSMRIRSGESVGIVGASGCGKSTLIRLLLGFEKAEGGSIYIDGFDIRELDLRRYRQKLGTVLQDTGLISGDIYSNISITKPYASMNEVMEAIEISGLADTVAALPMGIHTPVSQENCTLSGGERQRVLIARAVISKPSILIFDEATSALDNITQTRITESINKLDCTKIIVAHRLSTIEQCDRIFVMDKGVIVQEGTYDELKNIDGQFKQLMKRQNAR